MTSEVSICNLALSNIRGGTIAALDEPGVAAQQCNLKYPVLRDRMLKELWGFNRKIEALSLLTTELYNWVYTYQYPTSCLKINRLVGEHEALTGSSGSSVASRMRDTQLLAIRGIAPKIPYELFNVADNRVIGTNESNLYIDYAARVTDPNLFSDDFTLALSHLLASEIAVAVVGAELGRKFRSDELKLYNGYISNAIADNMNEGYQENPPSEFELIRN